MRCVVSGAGRGVNRTLRGFPDEREPRAAGRSSCWWINSTLLLGMLSGRWRRTLRTPLLNLLHLRGLSYRQFQIIWWIWFRKNYLKSSCRLTNSVSLLLLPCSVTSESLASPCGLISISSTWLSYIENVCKQNHHGGVKSTVLIVYVLCCVLHCRVEFRSCIISVWLESAWD